MKTHVVYELGDQVEVTSTSDFGSITYINERGGTSQYPVGTGFRCRITKTWKDYEIGRRYVAVTSEGVTIYFGDYGVEIKPVEQGEFRIGGQSHPLNGASEA